jgi:hypothetical protein
LQRAIEIAEPTQAPAEYMLTDFGTVLEASSANNHVCGLPFVLSSAAHHRRSTSSTHSSGI